VSGSTVRVNDSLVTTTDVAASNGIIHVIDAVLLPPAAAAPAPAVAPVANNIVAVAQADGRFTTLLAALKAAGLEDTLRGPGNFTVFAPVNSAFDVLPQATLQNLLKPESRDQLRSILTFHVVGNRVLANQLAAQPGHRLTTLQGGALPISFRSDGAYINNAKVLITDIQTGNGVIHVIDTVMIPRG
jgi:transforming growth factor-beta-induced protein